jgi:Ca2+-binding EF-hand superfamily protein
LKRLLRSRRTRFQLSLLHQSNKRHYRRYLSTDAKKASWNYETVNMILVPIILGAAAVYVYWHAKRKNNIAKIEEYISRRYPIDQKELIKLRRMWNLSVKEVFYLHDYLNQNGFFNKTKLTLDEFLRHTAVCLQRDGEKVWLRQILNGFGENVEQLEVREWLLILTMLTNASAHQRKVLSFAILDEDDDGSITAEDFEALVRVATSVGWCYDTKMYKRVSKWPPDFALKDSKVSGVFFVLFSVIELCLSFWSLQRVS